MKSSNQSNTPKQATSVSSVMLRGLLALIPAAILGSLFTWALNTADGLLGSVVGILWGRFNTDGSVEHYRFMSLVLVGGICYGLGLLITWKVGNSIFTWLEDHILKAPGIGPLYGFLKRLRDVFSKTDMRMTYKGVAFVPFPTEHSRSLAFITGEVINSTCGTKYIKCIVPTSPTPFSGFAIYCREADVSHADLSIEEASQIVVSGGMICPAELALTPPTACALHNHTTSE
jgi:uncharacterized membrane protein